MSPSCDPRPPAISVVIATYNCAEALRRALESLVAQEFTDFEAWVVGDACTDDSASVVASFGDPRLHWTNLPANSGSQAAPNNEGLRRAQGECVAYLGHDDLWMPWHLAELRATIERTGAALVHGLAAIFDEAGVCGVSGPPPQGLGYRDHFIPPSAWLHRRDLVERIGNWRDPDTLGCAVDFDFSRRADQAGARIAFSPRLSVLKFPSAHFRLYARTEEGPQRRYLVAMQDSVRLERDVLRDLAVTMAKHPQQWLGRVSSDDQALGRAAAVWIRRRTLDRWRDVGWMAPLFRWAFQRKRRRVGRRRGLTG